MAQCFPVKRMPLHVLLHAVNLPVRFAHDAPSAVALDSLDEIPGQSIVCVQPGLQQGCRQRFLMQSLCQSKVAAPYLIA